MRTLFACLLIISSTCLKAQQNNLFHNPGLSKSYLNKYSWQVIHGPKISIVSPSLLTGKSIAGRPANPDNMPVKGYDLQLVYEGNNRSGFDIYRSAPDNIGVLNPDSTFSSNMPTGQYSFTVPGQKPSSNK